MITQQIVDLLNEAYNADPNAIDSLLCLRVPVNKKMIEHPTIQVLSKNKNGDFPVLGFLGILNGISSIDNMRIWADYDSETHCLMGFRCEPITTE